MSQKRIFIIRGPIGAGKTSVVAELRNLLGDASIVDFDAFKRQIDNQASSDWRRTVALETAAFMTEKLMKAGREIIVDIHSSSKEQFALYMSLASKHAYTLTSFLLYPSLEICKSRAAARVVGDITYEIDTAMVEKYWRNTFFIDHETTFSDSTLTPQEIASSIYRSVLPPANKNL